MRASELPLQQMPIGDLFYGSDQFIFEVPIYQRNYAWGIDEISALVQDVYDAYCAGKKTYFIGTLVTYHKGKHVYEVIDGQQRLTTIYLMLTAMGVELKSSLTYSSRKKSTETIESLGNDGSGAIANNDQGIENGFECVKTELGRIVPDGSRKEFDDYFQRRVHIVFYQVPKDIDLNHYFEVMNSRGEQLEQHEVVKAALLGKLDDEGDRAKFNRIWELCGDMGNYVQQGVSRDFVGTIFGSEGNAFPLRSFDELPSVDNGDRAGCKSISDLMKDAQGEVREKDGSKGGARFQPIIDFQNFLLIVLKLTRMEEVEFDPAKFILDDKEIIRQFDEALKAWSESGRSVVEHVKKFGFNLLLSKFYLDNYVVHHVLDDERPGDNPWKLQCWEWRRVEGIKQGYPVNLFGGDDNRNQRMCEQLLAMFEVSFTARQRKNYLLYCLLYLHGHKGNPREGYPEFLAGLAKTYLYEVYLGSQGRLNERNAPMPGSFDEAVLERASAVGGERYRLRDVRSLDYGAGDAQLERARTRFGDGEVATRGIPLFVFNYLDYLLWESYFGFARGCKKEDARRKAFFERLGCSDFGLDVFDDFYFSRTRRSLEHFYSQAQQARDEALGQGGLTSEQINCLGNFAMIGNDMNSSGSDWSPKAKLEHYLDPSGKINRVSVASLKFMVMMQTCKDNNGARPQKEWIYEDIEKHQAIMIDVLVGRGLAEQGV